MKNTVPIYSNDNSVKNKSPLNIQLNDEESIANINLRDSNL